MIFRKGNVVWNISHCWNKINAKIPGYSPNLRYTHVFSIVLVHLILGALQVVILYTDQEEARSVLLAARHAGLSDYFTWVGSDGLGVNVDDLDDLADVTHGSLVLKQFSEPALDFEQYFQSLSPETNSNPWLKPMWSELFHCYWQEPSQSTNRFHYFHNSEFPCEQFKHINTSMDYSLETAVPVIIDIVYTFAYALNKLRTHHCPEATGRELTVCVWRHNFLRYCYRRSNHSINF